MALIGTGTESNPYLISTVSDLKETYNYGSNGVHFKMTNDISLSGASGFPLGSFQGVFDGNGKKLSSLNVSMSTKIGVGIWAYVINTTIKNLHLSNFNMMGEARIGMVAGESYENVVFENVISSGTNFIQTYAPSGTNSKWSHAGGLIGFANNPVTYRNCGLRGMIVRGYAYVGIFQGYGSNSIFEQCYSHTFAGNSYAKTGGFGNFAGSQFAVTATTSYYTDTGGVGQGATLVSEAQLKQQSALTNFDFNTRWGIDSTINEGFATPKFFLPVLEPPVVFLINTMSYVKTLASRISWVNVVHPLIKAIHVGSHSNPLATTYTLTLQEVIEREIRTISTLSAISTNAKRLQFEKSVGNIVSYLNKITGNLVITKDIKPEIFDNLVSLLESGNDVSFIQHLINDVYVNETRHSTFNLQSKTEVKVVAYTGDTVTLKVNFKTYDDVTIEPTDVKVKIYQPTSNAYELISTVSLDQSSKTGIGEYNYTYTVPENFNNTDINYLVYEFVGTYNGQTTLARGKFSIRFV